MSFRSNKVSDCIAAGSENYRVHSLFAARFKEYHIIPELIECDFYDYLADQPYAVKAFHGEYMSQYGWAEISLGKYFYK